MKVIKRNQLVIFVIALMLVTAGYLNYTSNLTINNTIQTSGNLEIAGIGDATLVSSQAIEENVAVESSISTENEYSETIQTNQQEEDYFVNSKLQRDIMYSRNVRKLSKNARFKYCRNRTKSNSAKRNNKNKQHKKCNYDSREFD